MGIVVILNHFLGNTARGPPCIYIYVLIQRRNSFTNDHETDVISSKPHYLNRRSDRGFKVPDEKQTRVSTFLSLLKVRREQKVFGINQTSGRRY